MLGAYPFEAKDIQTWPTDPTLSMSVMASGAIKLS